MTRKGFMSRRTWLIVVVGVALGVVVALLGACAQVSGTIVEKEVEVTFKKKRAKTCYEFEIKQSDDTVTDICVSKSEYDRYNVGDKYP